MNLIIVGASPEGVSLEELALKDGHNVAIIEASEERALEVLQEYDIKVFHANITQGGILDEAGADQADAIIATTSDDSANLMTIFLAKERNIPTLISMVHEKEHICLNSSQPLPSKRQSDLLWTYQSRCTKNCLC